MAHDVTERRRYEKTLHEYERVVEGLDEMILVVDRQYRYLIANNAFLRRRGLTRKQVIGHSVEQLIGKDVFNSIVKPKLDECFEGKVVRYELRHNYPQFGERDLLVSYFPIEGSAGVDRAAAILQDITERKQAEDRLREYEKVIEGLDEMIVVVDRDYRYLIANHAFLKYREMEREEVIGRRVDEVVGSDVFAALIKTKMDECFEGKVVRYELRYKFPNLGERDLLASYFPIEGRSSVDRLAVSSRTSPNASRLKKSCDWLAKNWRKRRSISSRRSTPSWVSERLSVKVKLCAASWNRSQKWLPLTRRFLFSAKQAPERS